MEVRLQDESGYRWKGRVDFTDNAINAHSGTMRVRAVIDNPDYFLTPGMFGNMRLAPGGTVSALLVPDAAVPTAPARNQLFVVAKDATVPHRPTAPGPLAPPPRAPARTGCVSTPPTRCAPPHYTT